MVEYFCTECDHEDGDFCMYKPIKIDEYEKPEYCPITGNKCKWVK